MGFSTDLYSYLDKNLLEPNVISAGKGKDSAGDKYLIYNNNTDRADYELAGASGLQIALYQFDAYADRKVDAEKIIDELIELLEDYKGDMEGFKIGWIYQDDKFDGMDQDTEMYRQGLRVNIHYYRKGD